MGPFSVISRDDQVDDLEIVDGEPVTHERVDRALDSLSRDVAALGSFDDSAMPRTLLELPDLTAMSQWSEQRWSNWGNRIFWVGIVLGSVVALYLIWQPRRVPAPQREAAPTWHGQSAPAAVSAPATALPSLSGDAHEHEHVHEHGGQHQALQSSAAPSWPAQVDPFPTQPATPTQPSNPMPPAGASEFPIGAPAAAPAEPATAPSSDEWSHQQPDAGAVYTARSGETRLDGGAAHGSAGEAIPTGKIKSVVTP
jgi:hypothetical protein